MVSQHLQVLSSSLEDEASVTFHYLFDLSLCDCILSVLNLVGVYMLVFLFQFSHCVLLRWCVYVLILCV